MVAGLTAGALACGLFLLAHGVGLLFGARVLQGVSVGVLPGAAGAALLDLRPGSGAAPLLSSASLPGGLALILSNLAMAIPAVIADVATTHYGLHNTALVYSLAVAALVTVSFILRIRDISSGKGRT